ncbi:jg359 [Pararge aegeria aegeria]|uniref:Jg359 protein n=1 Tax=Pararge aegeria aegeria TaxID=348720 RepID=A0A8S4QWJ1_9NEOP|nr:jg359 [Pararge aegeria aegeria]
MEKPTISALKQIQKEMEHSKKDIQEMQDLIMNSTSGNFNEKRVFIEAKYRDLSERIKSHEIKIYNIERYARRKNLLFYGVDNSDHLRPEQRCKRMEKNVLYLLNNIMKIQCQSHDIEYIRSLRPKDPKFRSVVVTFVSMKKKIEILRRKKVLCGTAFYINDDIPLRLSNRRGQIKPK